MSSTPLGFSPPDSDPAIPTAVVPPRRKLTFRVAARWLLLTLASLWLLAVLALVALRFIDPPTTAVHVERRIQSWFSSKPYNPTYEFVPLTQISPDFQHSVIAAEDARFYQHHGFDFHQIQLDAADDLDDRNPHHRVRGASTLDQQLVKNLFFGTGRSVLRKIAEASLVPIAELVLGKQRILELYLNTVEWGPGIYGAEAASHFYFHTSARNINRHQGAQLAAILPAPLHRRPDRMTHYTAIIQERMRQMNW